MKSAALLLIASVFVVACSGGTGDPDDPVVTSDADTGAEGEVAADSGEVDSGSADTGAEDVAEDVGADTGKLTCTGSEAEPNDTRVTAAKLKDIDDCDGSGGTIKGVVGGGGDTDWWTYAASDTTLCRVDVVASTKSGVRLCVIATCKAGATKFESCRKGLKTTVGGLDGCCSGPGEATADVELDYSCTLVGSDDAANVWMRVDDPGGSTCKDYSVTYHF